MHQSLQGAIFHVEHTIPASRGGLSTLENLAWCSPSCNLHKSDRMQAVDPQTGQLAPLFNPRQDDWNEHFGWLDFHLTGRSPTERATIAALKHNTERRILIRRAEEQFELFPPA